MIGEFHPQMVKARYISDIPCDRFKKGGVFDVFLLPNHPEVIGFFDYAGEEYALPAVRFELLSEQAAAEIKDTAVQIAAGIVGNVITGIASK